MIIRPLIVGFARWAVQLADRTIAAAEGWNTRHPNRRPFTPDNFARLLVLRREAKRLLAQLGGQSQ